MARRRRGDQLRGELLSRFTAAHWRAPADDAEFLEWVDAAVLAKAVGLDSMRGESTEQLRARIREKMSARPTGIVAEPGTDAPRLSEQRRMEIYALLTRPDPGTDVRLEYREGRLLEIDKPPANVAAVDLGQPWSAASTRGGDPALEAIEAIEELLALFPHIKQAMLEQRAARTSKKVGRRSPKENYWLAREIADILANVPGIAAKASKAGPTVFSRVLKLCAECVGHRGSVERFAVAAAKQIRPAAIDEETWRTYLESTSKRGGKGSRS